MFTVQFPHWLQTKANADDDSIELTKLFCNWYPNRQIIKGRNYKYWNYNV